MSLYLKDGKVAGSLPIGEVTRSALIQMMVGRPMEEVFPAGDGEIGEPVLVVEGLASGNMVRDVRPDTTCW